jgi:hypothetical protein
MEAFARPGVIAPVVLKSLSFCERSVDLALTSVQQKMLIFSASFLNPDICCNNN